MAAVERGEVLPRIDRVSVRGPNTVRLIWKRPYRSDHVDLTGWIATGGEILRPLRDEAVFAKAKVTNYGAAIAWDEDGDLSIDAMHLKKLAEEQRPFDAASAEQWQRLLKISNNEAADLLQLSLSTWMAYKAGTSAIPAAVAMVCRVMLRDPILLQAHFRPRKPAGRPRTSAS
jgi:hypothetical protein